MVQNLKKWQQQQRNIYSLVLLNSNFFGTELAKTLVMARKIGLVSASRKISLLQSRQNIVFSKNL